MIISASRRTDIPTYYSDWFFNRIKEGFVCVRNPMKIHQVSKIALTPDVIDGIVFWTKNPKPMLQRLDLLKDYMYYFQFTVNAYGTDIEPNVPNKKETIIPVFHELSKMIQPERVIWRYDPIMISNKYTAEYHIHYFEEIAKRLCGYTKKCIISFVDLYRNTKNNAKMLGLVPLKVDEMYEIANRFAEIASKYDMTLESCAEKINLKQLGIAHGHCIDCSLFEKLLGYKLDSVKDKNQREECGCMTSIDIGMYNTCLNGCKYCYANFSPNTVGRLASAHNPCSPLLSGNIEKDDIVKVRIVESCKSYAINLFG